MSATEEFGPELVQKAISGTRIPPQEHKFKGYEGVELVCWISGSGPLVIAHSPGWGVGYEYLKKYFTPLTEKYTFLAINSRGTPPSAIPDASKMGSATMAEDLEALRIFLKLEKMTLMGHSNGAAVVQAYAVKYPTRVEKLLLLCAQLIGFTTSDDVRKKFLEARKDHPVYKEAIPGMAKAYAATTDAELTAGLAQLMPFYFADPECAASKEWKENVANGNVSLWAWKSQKKIDDATPMPDLGAVKAKTLIVLCDEDPVCTELWANKIHELISGSKLVVMKNSGHMPWHEATEEFWKTLFEFVDA
ncbi:alpha/beta-hydrolase [Rhizodiscina lignyota]|uniref:Alpha/beta-hydrolase n=1 Tax=Rhizodiscina lignyota TaxID=1504668 RepID=A0A9P4M094_9PEZI|nr:alpha/beta-hydrolase [Rhizodiscina lignyota]